MIKPQVEKVEWAPTYDSLPLETEPVIGCGFHTRESNSPKDTLNHPKDNEFCRNIDFLCGQNIS